MHSHFIIPKKRLFTTTLAMQSETADLPSVRTSIPSFLKSARIYNAATTILAIDTLFLGKTVV